MPGVEALTIKYQLKYFGHVVRMVDSSFLKAVFYSELLCGKGKQGGRVNTQSCGLQHFYLLEICWGELRRIRLEWGYLVLTGVVIFGKKL